MTVRVGSCRIPALCAGILLFAAACGRGPSARMAPTSSRGSLAPASGVAKIALVAAEPAATSRDQLSRTIETMTARLSAHPADSRAA